MTQIAQNAPSSEAKRYTTPLVSSPVATIHYGPTQINAPASFVFKMLRDVTTWPKWNTLVPDCRILSQPDAINSDSAEGQHSSNMLREGTLMYMNGSIGRLPFKLTALINKISPPDVPNVSNSEADSISTYSINWCKPAPRQDWIPMWMLRFERTHEIHSLEGDLCEVETWDCQAGTMAYPTKFLLGQKLQEQFKNWIEGLRVFCEEEWKTQLNKP